MDTNRAEIVGSGRSADVFAHGDGQVLRRYRAPRDTQREVAAMEHARAQGFPVPAARRLSDRDVVMDRVEGPTMLEDLELHPWRMGRHARLLASLHHRLHAIEAPAWLPAPLGEGSSLLHLDMHPANVILSRAGPVVIDWPNVARGRGAADAAHTWVVLACSIPPRGRFRQVVRLGRGLFCRLFLSNFEGAELRAELPSVCAYRLTNRTLPSSELDAIRRLGERASRG
jgi:aminoglycoside phosphotransferase (APT) family kinase protein